MSPLSKKLNKAALIALSFAQAACNTSDKNNQDKDIKIIEKPNVLFVSLDDLNNWIEPLGGHPQAKTPNLNKFAELSVNFKKAYCPSPSCNPSRTAIMSGLNTYTSGVYSNYQDWREVLKDYKGMGLYFRENGYYSAGAGKIYHYHMIDSSCWDEYWPSQKQNMPAEYMPQRQAGFEEKYGRDPAVDFTVNMPYFHNMYKMFDWAALDINDSMMGDFKSVDWVSDKLNSDHNKPFFLACGIYRPHVPWYVPKKYFDMFPLEDIQLPKTVEDDLGDVGDRVKEIANRGGDYHKHVVEAGLWKEAVQAYLASIAFCDAMFGKLMNSLQQSKYANNTIVVVWSDHGWQLGEKKHWRKFALWENVVQTVLMIKAPAGTKGLPEGSADGISCERVVSLMDMYPTLIELCGLPVKTNIDGRSIVPLLENPEMEWDYPAITTYNHSEYSIRNERWRYTIYLDGSQELYDHNNDPEEWYNLAHDQKYVDIIKELSTFIPKDPAPLKLTRTKLQSHHYPPFRSPSDYQDWINHGRDNQYIIDKWNSDVEKMVGLKSEQ